ncbi:E3 SUMO-protein ligase ZBED1-like [Drosophila ananassae]|uniref:E3 SUMO-protein ligase ZBED1-like n=1 Tax=Drosophila ananassae TaxID=7217 RepID=UPI001CFF5536|nr:E3 SUMO-protein ligase ZBED1-like [Drosophila ananassae]
MERYLKRTSKSDENVEEPAPGPKKKREASVAWDHFKKDVRKTHGVCNYCGKAIKTNGNTTNLLDHLRHMHPDRLKVGKGQNDNATALDVFVGRSTFYSNDSARKRKLDEMVMNMIAVDVQPFSCVEDEGLINLLREMDPRYKLPSRTHLRDTVLPNQYDRLKIVLISVLDKIDFLALTTDLWTSRANEGYITITCHFVWTGAKLISAVLATRQLVTSTNHTAPNIAETISSVLTEWAIASKVVCVVTDNDSTMKKACELLKYKHLPCVAHTINLLVQDALRFPVVESILSKCKSIVAYFKRSTVAYEKFKEAQGVDQPVGLLQEMPTRWNSAYEMIKRIIKTNEHITVVLVTSRNAPPPLTPDEVDV